MHGVTLITALFDEALLSWVNPSGADLGKCDRREAKSTEVKNVKSIASNKQVGGSTKMEDRYYVQCLTEQVFLIRERTSADGEPGPDDRIVRSFALRHDAYMYVATVNEKQKQLDEHHGHWAQPAI